MAGKRRAPGGGRATSSPTRCAASAPITIDIYRPARAGPRRADRGDGRGDRRARRAPATCATSASRRSAPTRCAARTRCIRSATCSSSTRCCRASIEAARAAGVPRAGRRRHRLRRADARPARRATGSAGRRVDPGGHPRPQRRASSARTWSTTSTLVDAVRGDRRRARASASRSSRSRGCWRAARTSSRWSARARRERAGGGARRARRRALDDATLAALEQALAAGDRRRQPLSRGRDGAARQRTLSGAQTRLHLAGRAGAILDGSRRESRRLVHPKWALARFFFAMRPAADRYRDSASRPPSRRSRCCSSSRAGDEPADRHRPPAGRHARAVRARHARARRPARALRARGQLARPAAPADQARALPALHRPARARAHRARRRARRARAASPASSWGRRAQEVTLAARRRGRRDPLRGDPTIPPGGGVGTCHARSWMRCTRSRARRASSPRS